MAVTARIDHLWDEDGALRSVEFVIDVDEDVTGEQCAYAISSARALAVQYLPDFEALHEAAPDHVPDTISE